MNHFRKTLKEYQKNLLQTECPFCNKEVIDVSIRTDKYFYVIKNKPSYDIWELHSVAEHLLLLPKKHVASISELLPVEQQEMIKLISEYEAQGYSIYARGLNSPRRSVAHQHTHLIKIGGKQAKLSIFSRKPYLLFKV